jgi:hypothetical protein
MHPSSTSECNWIQQYIQEYSIHGFLQEVAEKICQRILMYTAGYSRAILVPVSEAAIYLDNDGCTMSSAQAWCRSSSVLVLCEHRWCSRSIGELSGPSCLHPAFVDSADAEGARWTDRGVITANRLQAHCMKDIWAHGLPRFAPPVRSSGSQAACTYVTCSQLPAPRLPCFLVQC